MLEIEKFNLPKDPGCYLFKDDSGNIIYVGKAKNLKKRVKSYFQKNHEDIKTGILLSKIDDVEVILTDNEIEALLLENRLIKKHRPRFNLELKEGERFSYILITNERYPRILTVRNKRRKGRYFGPFVDQGVRKNAILMCNSLFKLRTCNKMPKRACLNYHINLCSAPCIKNITEEEYNDRIKKSIDILNGNFGRLISELKREMKASSDTLDYERAMMLRDQIAALEYLDEGQKVERELNYNQDILVSVSNEKESLIELFEIKKGVISNKKEFRIENDSDFEENLVESFIKLYYSTHDIPKEIIIESDLKDNALIEDYLLRFSKKKSKLIVPKRGDKLKLVEMVKKNAKFNLEQKDDVLYELKRNLRLPKIPKVIECFDVSTLQGTETVASMVQFVNASPNKSGYRRFQIKSFSGQDDFLAINEVVSRRYRRLIRENEKLPDLIVIDGGKGQLKSALNALEELDIQIPLISIAKEFEEIYTPSLSYPIRLDRYGKGLKLLQKMRDEAHRFAISYHRLKREKSLIS